MIIVTGGAGFIGHHLVKILLDEGKDVAIVDDLSTGQTIDPRASFYQRDVRYLRGSFFGIECIYHLACPASPVHYQQDPIKTLTTCISGTQNMLEIARQNDCPMLHVSTSEVYGDPQEHPQQEDYFGYVNLRSVRSCYDEGKRAAETLCFDYQRIHGVHVKVARVFNTYGPGMRLDDGRVVPTLVQQALSNEPLTLYGDGYQTRSFTYIDDTIRGLRTLMESQESRPVNIGSSEEVSINDIARMIIEQTNSSSGIEYLPGQEEPKKRKPDTTRARALGWKPQVSLMEGLERLLAVR